MNLYGSGRRHLGRLWEQLNTPNLAEVRLPDHISRSRLRPVKGMQMKGASREKECRALTVSRHHPSTNSSSSSNNNEPARLPHPITARDTGSRKVGVNDNRDKRHLQGSNNLVALIVAASLCRGVCGSACTTT